MATFAEYVESVSDPDERAVLRQVWEVAAAAAPAAEEGVSYGMPALKIGKSPLFAVQASAKHLAIYPFSPEAIDAVAERLDGFKRSKGSVQFSAERPLPDEVIVELVRLRRAEILG